MSGFKRWRRQLSQTLELKKPSLHSIGGMCSEVDHLWFNARVQFRLIISNSWLSTIWLKEKWQQQDKGSEPWSQGWSKLEGSFHLSGSAEYNYPETSTEGLLFESPEPSCHSRMRRQAQDIINCPTSERPSKQSCPAQQIPLRTHPATEESFLEAKELLNTWFLNRQSQRLPSFNCFPLCCRVCGFGRFGINNQSSF